CVENVRVQITRVGTPANLPQSWVPEREKPPFAVQYVQPSTLVARLMDVVGQDRIIATKVSDHYPPHSASRLKDAKPARGGLIHHAVGGLLTYRYGGPAWMREGVEFSLAPVRPQLGDGPGQTIRAPHTPRHQQSDVPGDTAVVYLPVPPIPSAQ